MVTRLPLGVECELTVSVNVARQHFMNAIPSAL